MIKVLALDLSTSTGYAFLTNEKHDEIELMEYGTVVVKIPDFNVNKHPEKASMYPYNIVDSANEIAKRVNNLISVYSPDFIVIENTVKGRNRNTQRALEFIHKAVLDGCNHRSTKNKVKYIDPSQWRAVLGIKQTPDDKKHNADVRKGNAKGKITYKHLSVRYVNETFNLDLLLKDNDIADAICIGSAFLSKL